MITDFIQHPIAAAFEPDCTVLSVLICLRGLPYDMSDRHTIPIPTEVTAIFKLLLPFAHIHKLVIPLHMRGCYQMVE